MIFVLLNFQKVKDKDENLEKLFIERKLLFTHKKVWLP